MNLFKNYTYSWKNMGVFKVALLCLGAAVGAYWHEVFAPYIPFLIVIGIVLGIYIATVSMKQQERK